jgi:hypothetical protein
MGRLCESFHNAVKSFIEWRLGSARTERRALDASRAAEPDGHAAVFHDDRHKSAPVAEAQHALEIGRALLDVDVLEQNVPPLTVITGGLGVGSSVLAEDVDHTVIVRL